MLAKYLYGYVSFASMNMAQINIRIEPEEEKLLSFLANKRNITKTELARELLLKSLGQNLMPELFHQYEDGQIGLKKLIILSHLTPSEVLRKIAENNIEPPISAQIDEYTSHIRENMIKRMKNGEISIKKNNTDKRQKNKDVVLKPEELEELEK